MDWITTLRRCFQDDRVLYSAHARREMRKDEFGPISDDELGEAVQEGEVIESYPDDTPYPSALILGMTKATRPLHAVFAYNGDEDQTIVVTAYQPDPDRWDDFRKRKR